MISGRELGLGIVGAWRLARNDASGAQYFDRSREGAIRSFWVMALLAPAQAVLSLMMLDMLQVPAIGLRIVVLLALFYVVDWLYFPALVLRIAPLLGAATGFAGYMAAYNYAHVPIYALALGVSAVAGLLPEGVAELAGFVLLAIVATIHYRLLRQMLAISPPQAGLLIFAGLSLSFALRGLMFALLAPGDVPAS